MTFQEFNFDQRLLDGLDSIGFDTPTPIQQQAIPVIKAGKDLIACAQTGTGKTAAFVLPIVDRITKSDHSHLNTLILAPTRELAQQIDQQIEGLAYFTGVSSICVYGGGDGAAWTQQQKAMKDGADIVIATPGRLLSILQQPNSINMSHLKHLVLDEADRMLDMGFYDDILRIIAFLPENRQSILFSATMPPKIRTLAQRILKQPDEINIAISRPPDSILQQAYMAYDEQKNPLLIHLLGTEPHDRVIIFASTKDKVKLLERDLRRKQIKVQAFHSDLEQNEREKIMQQYRNREIQVLIGTDILSRGIDIDGISLVVNYDVPPDPEDYVHRIGRTARAERTGTAITFINPMDQRRFFTIENLIGKEIPKLEIPEILQLGASPEYNPVQKKERPYFRKNKGMGKDRKGGQGKRK